MPRGKATSKRNKTKHELARLRERGLIDAPDLTGVRPEDAIQEALENALKTMRAASHEAAELEAGEHWIITEHPGATKSALHKAISWERQEREQVAYIAARMMDLDIEGRRVAAAEVLAEAIAPVIQGILAGLKLSAAQKKRAPEVVRSELAVLEGTAREAP